MHRKDELPVVKPGPVSSTPAAGCAGRGSADGAASDKTQPVELPLAYPGSTKGETPQEGEGDRWWAARRLKLRTVPGTDIAATAVGMSEKSPEYP
jgi:hypothetical protein